MLEGTKGGMGGRKEERKEQREEGWEEKWGRKEEKATGKKQDQSLLHPACTVSSCMSPTSPQCP